MLHPKIQHLRAFSSASDSLRPRMSSSRPRIIGVYGYIVAGFTLPFAVPALARGRSTSSSQGDDSNTNSGVHDRSRGELSLYHCCR